MKTVIFMFLNIFSTFQVAAENSSFVYISGVGSSSIQGKILNKGRLSEVLIFSEDSDAKAVLSLVSLSWRIRAASYLSGSSSFRVIGKYDEKLRRFTLKSWYLVAPYPEMTYDFEDVLSLEAGSKKLGKKYRYRNSLLKSDFHSNKTVFGDFDPNGTDFDLSKLLRTLAPVN